MSPLFDPPVAAATLPQPEPSRVPPTYRCQATDARRRQCNRMTVHRGARWCEGHVPGRKEGCGDGRL